MKDLELYIHIPFCVKKCAYCDFLSFADCSKESEYVDALLREIGYYGKRMGEYEVSSIYIGGGTPSLLEADDIGRIMEAVREGFAVREDAEISIECNPGVNGLREKFKAYRACGINRISIGCQSASDEELRVLGRIHTYGQFLETFQAARQAGFANINVDLMSGIPHQKPEDFRKSLMQILRLRPEHISAYSLIVEEGTPYYEHYHADVEHQVAGEPTEALPTEEEVCQMLADTRDILTAHGYERYEISNYARPGYACRHNLGYWERREYLGLGLGAASLLGEIRYANMRDLDTYIQEAQQIHSLSAQHVFGGSQMHSQPATQLNARYSVSIRTDSTHPLSDSSAFFTTNLHSTVEPLSRHDRMAEFMYLGLRKTAGVSRADFEAAFGVPIEAVYANQLRQLTQQGLLVQQAGRIYLTPYGLDISNYAMSYFI